MSPRRSTIYTFIAVMCSTSMACSGPNEVDVQGAGATFPAPIYKRWFLEYYQRNPDVRVNYQAIGSGAGVRQFAADLVDFGASDAAMSDQEIARAVADNPEKEGILMLPMTAGSIALCYNLPGAPDGLKLSRRVYADIFRGKITNWQDPAIVALNPEAHLPNQDITVVRRADGSGTTYVFTNHLSAVSPQWKSFVGVGKSVVWPTGIGGKGNAGVAALIDQTPGAIGYLEFGYAELLNLRMARLENLSGNYITPTLVTTQAALTGVALPDNLRVWIPDPPGAQAYPIVTYTWMLCWRNYDGDVEKSIALKAVLRYCLTEGQAISAELGYIPPPQNVATRTLQAVDTIKP